MLLFLAIILVTAPFGECITASFSGQGLKQIPSNIPIDTTTLSLDDNDIIQVNQENLVQLTSLQTLAIGNNNMTEFPNISHVGLTLQKLNLRDNKISQIDRDNLLHLISLSELILEGNRFVVFPDLTPLASTLVDLDFKYNSLSDFSLQQFSVMSALRILELDWNSISSFPNFTSSSIKTLSISFNPLVGPIPADLLQGIVSMKSLQMENMNLNNMPNIGDHCSLLETVNMDQNFLTTIAAETLQGCHRLHTVDMNDNFLNAFPNFTFIGTTLKIIRLGQNSIPSLAFGVLDPLDKLEELDLSNNALASFPDLTMVGNTLKILSLTYNDIAVIDSTYLDSLIKLQTLQLNANKIVSIPNVPGPGNTLKTLTLAQNLLDHFPQLDKLGQKLTFLTVAKNAGINVVNENHLVGLDMLTDLSLQGTAISELPPLHSIVDTLTKVRFSTLVDPSPIISASAYAMAALGSLQEVWLQGTLLSTIPSPCMESGLTLHLDNSLNLDICTCMISWLKMNQAQVKVDDVHCATLGKLWSTSSEEEIVELCNTNPMHGCTRELVIEERLSNKFCSSPLGPWFSDVSLQECLHLCLINNGCQALNYRNVSLECSLVAPYLQSSMPAASSNGWEYIAPVQRHDECKD